MREDSTEDFALLGSHYDSEESQSLSFGLGRAHAEPTSAIEAAFAENSEPMVIVADHKLTKKMARSMLYYGMLLCRDEIPKCLVQFPLPQRRQRALLPN